MTRRGLLLELAHAVSPDATVSVPAAWLLEALQAPIDEGDVTVPDLCRRYNRRASCIRAWLERGSFEGAYKLEGREWRVPRSALAAFDESQRTAPARHRGTDQLSSWRTLRKKDTA